MSNNKKRIEQPKVLKIDETHFILQKDYSFPWEIDGYNPDMPDSETKITTTIHVKKGFRWDGASVPKFLWSFGMRPDGKHRAAALIHDYIYIHEGKLPPGSITASCNSVQDEIQHGSFSRLDADRLFGKMLEMGGVGPNKRRFMKYGVTYFGWIYWTDGPDLIRKFIYRVLLFLMITSIIVMIAQKLY